MTECLAIHFDACNFIMDILPISGRPVNSEMVLNSLRAISFKIFSRLTCFKKITSVFAFAFSPQSSQEKEI